MPKLILRVIVWTLGLLVAAALLLAAVWLPFNLHDAAPKPRPAALQLPAPQVPDERNAAYAVVGLNAAAGRDAAEAGRALWAAHRAWAALPQAQRAAAAATRDAAVAQALGQAIAAPKGGPLHCEGQRATCDAEWLAAAEALSRQRAGFAALGERCSRLVDGPFEFEELLPPGRGPDAPLMPWLATSDCSRFFRSGAMVALARGQRDEAVAQLRWADRLHRQLWAGARTLVGVMVATRLARNTYDTVAAVAMREPSLAEALAPALAAPLDTRSGARRWMLFEADFQRGLVDELVPVTAAALSTSDSALSPLVGGPAGQAVTWLARRGIGLLPERTRQRIDEIWLRKLGALQYEWPAVLAGAAVEARSRQQAGPWARLQWRNTIGEALLEAADADYGAYFARHADHELHREATRLVLALQRQRVPPAQRALAARKLPGVSETLKERMTWSADGRVLTVRAWQSETPGAVYDPRRDAIAFTWP